ncbi:ROK family transcriptional regulator [Streptomyces kunmingensis]|uniref:ROK family transcriptional regulator n=1 Tax=Streptomyces kunmingensis TaxID=68225 RepID=A0ABU6CN36_9ACTN|nr:ROK family transcriptional regulator [Streptomyces kunmingensis]MEB3966133.1 ROK family transcriptional regulator [Streptomyces kunmingensis]
MANEDDLFGRLPAASPTRAANRRKVLLAVAIRSGTQADIAHRTLLSQATVSAAVRELGGVGLVPTAKERGKVCLSAVTAVGVGVHLGFNHMTVVARRLDMPFGQVTSLGSSEGVSRGWSRALPEVRQMIDEAIEGTGRRRSDVFSLGIAVPRMINPRTGGFTPPILPPWRAGDDPAKDLGTWLGVRAFIDNDANLGALAEQTYGSREHAETVVYVKASTGVGAGIIVHNSVLRGHGGMAGELGHLTVDPHGAVCQCGGRGCLETVIGADALIAQVRAARTRNSVPAPETLEQVIGAAQAQDAVCMRVIHDAGRRLGQSLAQLCNLLNPDLVVIGGQLAQSPLLLDGCRESLRRFALPGAVAEDSEFVLDLSELDTRAEAQGALILGLRGMEHAANTT